MADPVQFTRGTLAAWQASTKVLLDGQLGYVRHADGTFEPKMGNGADQWEDLPGQKLPTSAVARYTTIDVVADHGADRTGATSAVSAVNAALAAANTAGGKVVVWFPPGTYDLAAGLTTAIATSNVYIVGAGRGATTLKGQSGTLFTWGSGLDGGGLSDCTLWYPSPDADSRVALADKGHRIRFNRLTLNNVRQLAQLGTSTGTCGQAAFRQIYGYTDPTSRAILIDAVNGSALSLENVIAFPLGVSAPTGTDPHPGSDTTFLRFGQGNWDTVHAHGVVTNRFGRAVDINASGAVACVNMWFTACVFDYNKYNGIRITVAGGANVRTVNFTSGWAVASDGYSIEVGGTGSTIKHLHFTDFFGRQAGKSNWRFSGTSMDDVVLTNCMGMGANRLTGNTGVDQDDLTIQGSGVKVRGGTFGEPGSSYGVSGQGRYGVSCASNLDVLEVVGVRAEGATGAILGSADTAASARRVIRNNTTPTGVPAYATTATVIAPSSGVTTTHVLPYDATLYIYGGKVTDIKHNGTTVATAGPATLVLRPGDTWAVTYSVAPTLKRVVSA